MLRCLWSIAQEARPGGKSGTANLISSCHQHIPWYMREAHGMAPLDFLVPVSEAAQGSGMQLPQARGCILRQDLSLFHGSRCLLIIHTAHILINPHNPLLHRKKTKQQMIKLFSPNSSQVYVCIYFVACVREQALLVFADPCP